MTCTRSYAWFLNFLSNVEAWDCFWLQNDQFENLYNSSHGEARNIKLGQQVNLIQRVLLGTLPQKVLTSLPHIYWLWQMSLSPFFNLLGLRLTNLGRKKTPWWKSIRHFSIGDSNIINFWLFAIDKSLHQQL